MSAIPAITTACQKKSCVGKSLWTLFVIICWIFLSIHIFFQIRRYASHDKTVDQYTETNGFRFPDVTFCPSHINKPIDETKAKAQWTSYFPDYVNRNDKEMIDEAILHSTLLTSNFEDTKLADYLLNNDILYCKYGNVYCDKSYFKIYRHPTKVICLTFSPQYRSIAFTGSDSGLTIILKTSGTNFIPTSRSNKMFSVSGYTVDIHAEKTRPVFGTTSFIAQPGTETQVQVKMITTNDFSTPKDYCQKEPENVTFITKSKNSLSENTFKATLADCKELQLQLKLMGNCYCSDIALITGKNEVNKYELCHDLDLPKEKVVNNAKCFWKYSEKTRTIPQDSQECYRPCDDTTYTTNRIFGQWPINESMVEIKTSQQIFKEKTGQNAIVNINENDKLIAIRIYPSDLYAYIVEKKIDFSILELFSESAGVVGLWIGWCALTFFEFMEWLVFVCMGKKKCVDGKDSISSHENVHLDPI